MFEQQPLGVLVIVSDRCNTNLSVIQHIISSRPNNVLAAWQSYSIILVYVPLRRGCLLQHVCMNHESQVTSEYVCGLRLAAGGIVLFTSLTRCYAMAVTFTILTQHLRKASPGATSSTKCSVPLQFFVQAQCGWI